MEIKTQITWAQIYERVNKYPKHLKYYGVPRGGSYIAAITGNAVMTPEEADVIVDDLVDSGATRDRIKKQFPDKSFQAVFNKQTESQIKGKWLEFPWEQDGAKECEENVSRILQYIGEDTSREGLKETPKRFLKFLKEFTTPEEFNFTMFKNEGHDEMIIQKNIPFYSLCEHHIAPFFGTCSVAYIPDKKIVGISKLARTVDLYSKRLQNQERITTQIAERLMEELQPKGVAVSMTAQHLCMSMRGVKKHDTWTTTSCLKGFFRTDPATRNEFLILIK